MKKILFFALSVVLGCLHPVLCNAAKETQPGNNPFDAFIQDRYHSITVTDSISNYDRPADGLVLDAVCGEYLSFQVGVMAYSQLDDVQVSFKKLRAGGGLSIPVSQMTCFSQGGIDWMGQPFNQTVSIAEGKLHPLWCGVDLTGIQAGEYTGTVTVAAAGRKVRLPLCIRVAQGEVQEKGCSQGDRMSRLSWLNSTLGQEDEITKPFISLAREGNDIRLLGRSLTVGDAGWPQSFKTFFNPSVETFNEQGQEVLAAPMTFVVTLADGTELNLTGGKPTFTASAGSSISWKGKAASKTLSLDYTATLEYDGYLRYDVSVQAKKEVSVRDICLNMPMARDKAKYVMGLGLEGGNRPSGNFEWKWDVTKNQDMLWIGDVNGGIRLKLMDDNYRRPLVNIYYAFGQICEPASWGNGGRGGVRIEDKGDIVLVKAYSGERSMKKGDALAYDFEMLLTPFKPVDKQVKYGDRYHHVQYRDETRKITEAVELGANVLNVHHKETHYPFINYPYLDENVPVLKELVNKAHDHGKRMKFYYTTREITKNFPEFWAFNSLQGEVIFPGPGNSCRNWYHPNGPSEWLKTNLKENYIPAWHGVIGSGKFKGETDLSVITTPDSRLNNYYVAGLDWMVRNIGIDGIYIDDSALDRVTMRRARRIIDRNRPEGRIDMHSCNHFQKGAGYANCLNIYMELMPYLDLTWIGEGRNYNRKPDHWLIEVCSLPFGVPGQMLQDGGNRWRGMIYGITNRVYSGDGPTPIWKFWDQYDIASKEMIGYWDDRCPVSTDDDMVKATMFVGPSQAILAVASWCDGDKACNIHIDWNKLGFSADKVRICQPAIDGYQDEQLQPSLRNLTIPKGKGFLFVIDKE